MTRFEHWFKRASHNDVRSIEYDLTCRNNKWKRCGNLFHKVYSFLIMWWLWKEPLFCGAGGRWILAAKSVECASLPLQCVNDVHGSNRLAFGMLAVCHCIADHVLKEDFQDSAGFFVDEARDSLHSAPSCQTTDCWLGDALDVITKNFAVPLCSSLS